MLKLHSDFYISGAKEQGGYSIQTGSEHRDWVKCHSGFQIKLRICISWVINDDMLSLRNIHHFLELSIKCSSKECRLQNDVLFMPIFQNLYSGHKV